MVLNIPLPGPAEPTTSPVPAYNMFGFPGSIVSEATFKFAIKSPVEIHDAPALVDLHTPPPAAEANIVFGFVGSMTIARVRPPMLPGPSGVQPPNASGFSGPITFLQGNI